MKHVTDRGDAHPAVPPYRANVEAFSGQMRVFDRMRETDAAFRARRLAAPPAAPRSWFFIDGVSIEVQG